MNITDLHNLSDENLVIEFQSNKNQKVFGEIYHRHYKKVFQTCLGVVKDREIAQDLVQDVMIKVMEKLPELKHPCLLRLWLHRIAKNYSIDYCKVRKSRLMVCVDDRFDMPAEELDYEAIYVKEGLLEGMERALNNLAETDRTILTLKYYNNYSIEDLQNQYALSESAVKMRLARARNRIATCLN